MNKMTINVDCLNGKVKYTIFSNDSTSESHDFSWHVLSKEEDKYCFISASSALPIDVTQAAAESLLNIVKNSMQIIYNIQDEDIKVYNEYGEETDSIEFIPPTFSGDQDEILDFIEKQYSIQSIYDIYRDTNTLDSNLINSATEAGVLEDVLCLIQFKIVQLSLALKQGASSNG